MEESVILDRDIMGIAVQKIRRSTLPTFRIYIYIARAVYGRFRRSLPSHAPLNLGYNASTRPSWRFRLAYYAPSACEGTQRSLH